MLRKYIEAPCFYEESLLRTLDREQLIAHALKVAEYAQKLEAIV